jgi:glycosyltransferase involved in cell wall biosynthesis
MRILYVGNIQSVHLRRWVSAAVAAGDEASVCSFAAGACEVNIEVMRTYGLGKAAFFLCMPQLNRIVRDVQPDIVHAHYLTSYGAFAALAGVHPLVVTAWGSDLLPVPTTTPLHRWAARLAIQGADVVTVVADHMKDAAIRLGADGHRLETVPFGVDLSVFKPTHSLDRTGAPLIVCTRNFDDVYRVDALITAVARLKAEGRQIRCQLIGDGPLRGRLEQMARAAGVGDIVHFLGAREPFEVARVLASADVFVSPSVSDGNNVSLTEALACGTFPVATDIPANRQWIEHGITGLLFSPGDVGALTQALSTALDSPALRQHARGANLDVVRKTANWDLSVARMRALYRRTIDDTAQARLVA